MLRNKTILFILAAFLITSCGGNSWEGVKRGITGAKQKTGDEFLVKKKDPLILPPDFENLPTPDDTGEIFEEISIIEKRIKKEKDEKATTKATTSSEKSLIEKIKEK